MFFGCQTIFIRPRWDHYLALILISFPSHFDFLSFLLWPSSVASPVTHVTRVTSVAPLTRDTNVTHITLVTDITPSPPSTLSRPFAAQDTLYISKHASVLVV